MRGRRRKCLCCGALFRPDARNRRHQRYCSGPACRKASKAASQRRWLAKPPNRDYFKGAENVARVKAWRAAHPGYGRGRPGHSAGALQDECGAQGIDSTSNSATLMGAALQEVLRAQPTVLIGLIAHLTDSRLQEDIARSSRRLLELGQDILGGRLQGVDQTAACPRAGAHGAGAVQLGRSAPGA